MGHVQGGVAEKSDGGVAERSSAVNIEGKAIGQEGPGGGGLLSFPKVSRGYSIS